MELKMYLAVLRKWLWLSVVCSVLAALVAYIVSSQQTRVYLAEATVLLDNSKASAEGQAYSDILAGERLARTYSELIAGQEALHVAISMLGYEPDILTVSADPQRDTTLLIVQVESNDPEAAAFTANTLPGIVGEQQRLRQAARYSETKASLTAELEALASDIEDLREQVATLISAQDEGGASRLSASLSLQETSYEALLQNLAAIRLAEAQELDVLSLVEPAEVPDEPIRPRLLLNTLLATAIGALVGLGIGFLIEYLDDTVKVGTDLVNLFDLGTLALIGRLEQKGERVLITDLEKRSPVIEAYRMLRTNIRFAAVDKQLRTLVLTSPGPGEGKSTTTANLAVVLAQAGHQTILVDADLRRPVQHHIFKISNRTGLTSALVERDVALESYLHETNVEGLRVLPTGPIPPNPSELLGSQRMRDVLHELETIADFVIIDSAPVLAVSDTSLLASAASGVLLVLRANATQLEATHRALQQLLSVHANVIGTVLNDVRSDRDGYYYYYYHQDYYTPGGPDDQDVPTGKGGSLPPQKTKSNAGTASFSTKIRTLLLTILPRKG